MLHGAQALRRRCTVLGEMPGNMCIASITVMRLPLCQVAAIELSMRSSTASMVGKPVFAAVPRRGLRKR